MADIKGIPERKNILTRFRVADTKKKSYQEIREMIDDRLEKSAFALN